MVLRDDLAELCAALWEAGPALAAAGRSDLAAELARRADRLEGDLFAPPPGRGRPQPAPGSPPSVAPGASSPALKSRDRELTQ